MVIVDEFEDEVDGTELLDETEELLKHCEQEFSLELLEVVLHIWHVAVEVIVRESPSETVANAEP